MRRGLPAGAATVTTAIAAPSEMKGPDRAKIGPGVSTPPASTRSAVPPETDRAAAAIASAPAVQPETKV